MTGEKSYSEFVAHLNERTSYDVELEEHHESFVDLTINAAPDISILSPIRSSDFRLIKVERDRKGSYRLRVM